ncbi:MAG: nitroreductase family protein [Puia sp.]|nr:nitroreductase family protein [Puia sp.]
MNELLTLIKERHSTRGLFDPSRRIAREDLDKIMEAARWAPTAHNMQNFEVILVDDRNTIGAIAAIKTPVSLAFVRENYEQLSFSAAELSRKKTGILGSSFPVAWLKPGVRKKDLRGEDGNEFLRDELLSAPVLGIVLYEPARRAPASKGDFLGIISLGCMMENMWMMAQSLGIGFHIVSSLSNGSPGKGIRRMLAIPKKYVIAYSFRLGYLAGAPQDYLRVRRDLRDFVHNNKYGKKWDAC